MTTLSTAARSAIVSSYVKALDAHETSGSLVTQVCETANRYMKGEEIPEEDRKAIIADIARAKGWKGASAKSRMSECNVILKAYAKLGEAIEMYRAKTKRVQWHDSMKLARRINAGDSVQKAVSFAMRKGSGSTVTPKGRVAAALKAWYKSEDVTAKEKAMIAEAVEVLRITNAPWLKEE
jgi:hypothetical protein